MENMTDENFHAEQSILAPGAHAGFYEIRVKGQLDDSWSDWLEGLEVEILENGEMLLSGNIVDQAALVGVLNKLYRLNLAIRSVSETNPKE
jgi:hypothetical protein